MSLITRCPACATMFRVVPDQLRISEGWVRCGQCDEVFDANAHLHSAVEPAGPVAGATEEPAPPAIDWEQARPEPDQPAPNPSYDWGLEVRRVDDLPDEDPLQDFQQAPAELPAQERTEVAMQDSLGAVVSESLASDYSPAADPILSSSPERLPLAPEPVAEPAAAAPQPFHIPAPETYLGNRTQAPQETMHSEEPPSFMRGKQSASSAGKTGSRIAWALACMLLLLAFALQFAYRERNSLAAAYAELGPVLNSACDVVGCKISAPRRIDAISIDSSAFNSIKPGVYVLQVTLKNAAHLPLESPALELTLTDTQDQPLLRRVITMDDYSNQPTTIAATSEKMLSIPISVHTGSELAKIAGYKLLAFYP